MSCELLSNYYLCSGKNNFFGIVGALDGVVNCFRITIFAVAKTMAGGNVTVGLCCELLSNYYLCSGKNNSMTIYVN